MVYTQTDIKTEVARILERHIGASNPIKGMELAAIFGFNDDRLVRSVIRELIASGTPIVSRTEKPAGYFIATSYQEVQVYNDSLRSRLINDALRIRDLKKSFGLYWNGNRQGKLI